MAQKLKSILVVEDERVLNNAYQVILRRAGYHVRAAFDGEEALKMVTQSDPDLIVLDLRMPKMSGNAFLQHYNLKTHPLVKVIVFSNYDLPDEINTAYQLGADRYILKALASPKELIKVVQDVLAKPKNAASTT